MGHELNEQCSSQGLAFSQGGPSSFLAPLVSVCNFCMRVDFHAAKVSVLPPRNREASVEVPSCSQIF